MSGGKQELTLTVHHRSDVGRVRDHNEDYLGYRQPQTQVRAEAGWLYAVADGVGGAQAGEVASKLAVQTLLAAYYRSYQETLTDRLHEAFAEANRVVHEQSSDQEGLRRMSTTLVAAAIRGRELAVANVGDSRAYLIHDGQMRQITRDHSMAARLVAEGIITPEQAESHPQRHLISRSIGAHPQVKVDVFTEAFTPGDRLLLCSDGLTGHVTDAEILAAVQDGDPEAGVQQLVDLANERGGQDNITVLVVRALREREDHLPPPETEKAPPSKRLPWPWVGAIAIVLLICVAGLAGGAFLLLNPTPTPTPTATTTPLPPVIVPTATATLTPTETPSPGATSTATLSPTLTATASPTDTPPPTATETASPTPTETLTPTPTGTSELSPLPTPTDTATPTLSPSPTPTPTGTTASSPLPTPTP